MRAGRRTQVVKGAVCKTAMQRFDPARRLQTSLEPFQLDSRPSPVYQESSRGWQPSSTLHQAWASARACKVRAGRNIIITPSVVNPSAWWKVGQGGIDFQWRISLKEEGGKKIDGRETEC